MPDLPPPKDLQSCPFLPPKNCPAAFYPEHIFHPEVPCCTHREWYLPLCRNISVPPAGFPFLLFSPYPDDIYALPPPSAAVEDPLSGSADTGFSASGAFWSGASLPVLW